MFSLLSFLCWLLLLFSIYLMLRTWRQARPVKPWHIAIGQGLSLVALWLYTALTGFPLGGGSWLLLLAVGAAGGAVYGGFVKVQQSPQGIVMTYTIWYLLAWLGLLALTQLTTILFNQVPVLLLGLSVLSLGLNLGLNGRVLHRYQRLHGRGV